LNPLPPRLPLSDPFLTAGTVTKTPSTLLPDGLTAQNPQATPGPHLSLAKIHILYKITVIERKLCRVPLRWGRG